MFEGVQRLCPRWMRVLRPQIWIVCGAVMLLGGRWLWLDWRQPAHAERIAIEFGALGYLYGRVEPDHTGRQVAYVQTTEKGIGVFVSDTQTLERQVVHDLHELDADIFNRRLEVWPWSPDDRRFVFTRQEYGHGDARQARSPDTQQMIIWSRDEPPVEVPINVDIIAGLTWLEPDTFVYVTRQNRLRRLRKGPDGAWTQRPVSEAAASPVGLATVDSETIAFVSSNRVCVLDLESGERTTSSEITRSPIVSCHRSSRTGRFLLNCADGSVWQWDPRPGEASEPVLIDAYLHATNAVWAGPAPGWAWENCSFGREVVFLTNTVVPSAELFGEGYVEGWTATADGLHLFITGGLSNEPAPGIWDYEVETAQLRRVVSCSERPLRHARRVAPEPHFLMEHLLTYHLYRPADFNPRRRYPLLIGYTPYRERLNDMAPVCAQTIANCGAYVVIIDRDIWMKALDTWNDDLMAVYDHLRQDKAMRIDFGRVTLFARSVENQPLGGVLATNAGPWQAMIGLNGTPSLPEEPTRGHSAVRLLVSIEGRGASSEQWLRQYQEKAARSGMRVEYVLHRDAPHDLLSKRSLTARNRALVDFMFGP